MSQQIEAIYENGIFTPLRPVDLPEGTHVHIEADASSAPTPEAIRQHLEANGASPGEAEKILDNFRLLWSSYDTLSSEQKTLLEQSRLDLQHFFDGV